MNNYILISRTYTETTPESAAEGDFSKRGFISRRLKVTFSQLVDLMSEHPHPSESPNDGNTRVWYSTDYYTSNYTRGVEREESMHYHRQNTPNAAKYWRWARLIADQKSIDRCKNAMNIINNQ